MSAAPAQEEAVGTIQDRLLKDLQAAMRAQDRVRRSALRSLRTALARAEEKAGRALSDADALNIISREATVRREAIDEYEAIGRADLAEVERAEAAILAEYLPQPLSDDELREAIRSAIAATGATDPREIGLVMKELVPTIRGRADAGVAKQIAQELLAGR